MVRAICQAYTSFTDVLPLPFQERGARFFEGLVRPVQTVEQRNALVWQPGHWDWTGSSYVWTPGQYVEAANHSGNWMPSYWEKTRSGWVWRAAHWM